MAIKGPDGKCIFSVFYTFENNGTGGHGSYLVEETTKERAEKAVSDLLNRTSVVVTEVHATTNFIKYVKPKETHQACEKKIKKLNNTLNWIDSDDHV